MGKGDQKSTRGKRVRGRYGKTRPRKSSQPIAVTEKPTKVKAEPKPKAAKPKAEKAEETEEKPKVKHTKKAEE